MAKKNMVAFMVVVGLVAAMGGCAGSRLTPAEQELRSARDIATVAYVALTVARTEGAIDDEDWQAYYLPLIHRSDAMFDRLRDNPDLALVDAFRDELQRLALDLARAQARAEGGGPP